MGWISGVEIYVYMDLHPLFEYNNIINTRMISTIGPYTDNIWPTIYHVCHHTHTIIRHSLQHTYILLYYYGNIVLWCIRCDVAECGKYLPGDISIWASVTRRSSVIQTHTVIYYCYVHVFLCLLKFHNIIILYLL